MRRHLVPLLLALLLLAGCGARSAASASSDLSAEDPIREVSSGSSPASSGSSASDPESLPEPEPPLPDTLLAGMTLREKVGQLFVVRPNALLPDRAPATGVTDAMREMLERCPVGGIAQFGENILSPEQLKQFNRDLQDASALPLFLAVDEEGGPVARLANHSAFDLPRYESALSVGAGGDPTAALEMGQTIGGYLREYGFNVDFAPDADVNTNPDNPVIGKRAFSSDPAVAAEMASAMAEGLRQQGILPVFKHFPGHGDTAQDSHSGLASSDRILAQLMECEWLPFREAGPDDAVMVGHIALPMLTGTSTPASLSYLISTDVLRHLLGFEGLVITDSLEMGAITQTCGQSEAAVLAFQAGTDLILMPLDLPEAFDAVLEAVEDGTIPLQRLDDSVLRILQTKERLGLLDTVASGPAA